MSGQLPRLARLLVLAAQEDLPTVRLVGGAGLGTLLGHRISEDIDLFCESGSDIPIVVSRLEAAARAEGAALATVRIAPTFRRIEVASAADLVRLDVAADAAPLLDAECPTVEGIRVLSLRDQRANKIVTLLGRSELRDLVDLFCLEREGWPLLEGIDDAMQKDAGVDLAWLAWAMRQIEVRPLLGLIAPLDLQALRRYRDGIAEALLDRAGALPEG
ncbi:MAG: nucleotidyl transferase AbiEii/AbiGii toxin family protein [Polyangiaceae bacterium]|nr:nucleotidyl transferase AbiEii/AbiGii toxin family protein [Polyangiaceae bacterium]